MQSGTQLHLALLRKISQIMPTNNYRQRFNQSRRKRQFFKCNMTEQSNEEGNLCPLLPLFETNSNLTPIASYKSKKSKSKQLFKEENTTISAWSIDQKDRKSEMDETRYNQKLGELSKNEVLQVLQPKKKRNFSFNHGIQLKKGLPELEYARSPSHDYNSRLKLEKEHPIKCKFSKIKHINLNLQKQNGLSVLEHFLLKDAKIKSAEKISSYNAFVSQMKMHERSKKLRD